MLEKLKESYKVTSGEEHLYHCLIEQVSVDKKGKRLSTPRVQKFGKKGFESMYAYHLKNKADYDVEILHNPNDYFKQQEAERVAKELAEKEAKELEAQQEAERVAKELAEKEAKELEAQQEAERVAKELAEKEAENEALRKELQALKDATKEESKKETKTKTK